MAPSQSHHCPQPCVPPRSSRTAWPPTEQAPPGCAFSCLDVMATVSADRQPVGPHHARHARAVRGCGGSLPRGARLPGSDASPLAHCSRPQGAQGPEPRSALPAQARVRRHATRGTSDAPSSSLSPRPRRRRAVTTASPSLLAAQRLSRTAAPHRRYRRARTRAGPGARRTGGRCRGTPLMTTRRGSRQQTPRSTPAGGRPTTHPPSGDTTTTRSPPGRPRRAVPTGAPAAEGRGEAGQGEGPARGGAWDWTERRWMRSRACACGARRRGAGLGTPASGSISWTARRRGRSRGGVDGTRAQAQREEGRTPAAAPSLRSAAAWPRYRRPGVCTSPGATGQSDLGPRRGWAAIEGGALGWGRRASRPPPRPPAPLCPPPPPRPPPRLWCSPQGRLGRRRCQGPQGAWS